MAGRDSLELGSLASSDGPAPGSAASSSSSSPSGPPSSRKLSFENEDPLAPNFPPSRHQHNRSISLSSAFDFAGPVFPLSSTNGYTSLGGAASLDPTLASDGASLERHKSLTYLNGLSLVIGLVIGAGIFSSPSQVNRNSGSPGAALIVWTVAGLLTWTGAASYAELGGAMPLNGGSQMYLTKIFGDMAGFMFSWCTVCVLKPGSTALIAIIFGDYISRAIIGAELAEANPWFNKIIALLGLLMATLVNVISTRLSMRMADVFMFFKFVALMAVAGIGIVVAVTGFSWNGRANQEWRKQNWFDGTQTNFSNLAVALYAGLWAYDGWDNVNYVTGELIRPARDLPRVVHTSLPLVLVSYLLANTAYFLVLPWDVTSTSTAIATDMGAEVFGGFGSFILALAVAGSCFGGLNATTFTSSRLFVAAAKEGYLPSIIGTLGFSRRQGLQNPNQEHNGGTKVHFRWMDRFVSEESRRTLFLTPIAALALNFALTALYVILGTFSTLLTFYGVAGYFFYFLTVLGLIVLRVREPDLERPYRCWITTPVIFCCVSLFLLSRSIVAAPWTSLAIVPFVLVGFGLYFLRFRTSKTAQIRQDSQPSRWLFWKRWGRR